MPLPDDHPYAKSEAFGTDPSAPGAEEDQHFDLESALQGLGRELVQTEEHRSGFVNVVGRPNVGKSTLVNALVGERMNIVTAKPQTTRHRIFALLSGQDFQAVFSDTPGLIEAPSYAMQQRMNAAVAGAFTDADVVLFVAVPQEEYEDDHVLMRAVREAKEEAKIVVVINKVDTASPEEADGSAADYAKRLDADATFVTSARDDLGVDALREYVLQVLPKGPPYYPKDQLTDRPERFFVTEIMREQILEHYYQEIPYAVEPVIEHYEDTVNRNGKPLAKIRMAIYVERESQKNILIGKGGRDIKEVCYKARVRMEEFLDSAVFLDTKVKVKKGWRDDERQLRSFGY